MLWKNLSADHVLQSDQSHDKHVLQLRIDVNTADVAELTMLPKIGKQTALKIIEERQKRGRFEEISELCRVPGIGPATLSRIEPMVGIK
ncbi:MAG: helix-hairpin-helix domain-containing protein [Pirellulaceae bacterium]